MQTSFPKEKIKVVLFEGIHPVAVETLKQSGYTNVELLNRALPEAELIEKLQDVRMIGIRSKTHLTKKVLESANKLQAVACFCIGTNQVDLKTASDLGISVFNSPYSNTRSVAELVIAEIIMIQRGIPERSWAAHEQRWLKSTTGSFEVRGKTIGIVGYGRIGTQVSILAEAMGMKVLYYDIEPKMPLGNAQDVESMAELLAESDYVTLHVPETPETKYMFGAAEFAQMKDNAVFLNLSRGTVVDIDALKAALESGKVKGAGVDVFPVEPSAKGQAFETPLQGMKNVILTPHIGGATFEAQYNIGKDAATKLINYMDSGSTFGSHTIPNLSLPVQKKAHRILHIHRNKPGIIAAINNAIAEEGGNILGQYLKTDEELGYAVVDVDRRASKDIEIALQKIDHTIRVRLLY